MSLRRLLLLLQTRKASNSERKAKEEVRPVPITIRQLAYAAIMLLPSWGDIITTTDMSLQKNGGWGNVHEKTHGVNSELRQRHGGDCFYVMWGRCAKFQKLSRPTISQVAPRVRIRGGVAWYLTGSPDWNNQPLYLFDELVSYTNGTVDAWNNRRTDNNATLQFALEFQHYCATLVRMIPADYPDRQRVAKFWCWNALRLNLIAEQSQVDGFLWRDMCPKLLSQMRTDWTEVVKIAATN